MASDQGQDQNEPDNHEQRVHALFMEAIELPEEERTAFLNKACGSDETLMDGVLTLLASHSETPKTEKTVTDRRRSDPMLGKVVGRYTIRREIGRGGMGVVYEAVQQSPRRTVALKMIKPNVTSRNALRRFDYEAQTLGRLEHDGIARIYEAGTWDDGNGPQPWFAMGYLIGAKSLTDYCNGKKLGTRQRLDIFRKICSAVAYAHTKGIVHRDLKPSNILVTANGVPKIIDFGVARSIDSDLAMTSLQTDIGALIGTLQYMSPEQCEGDPNAIDTRSDVYALGVILYELLCGQLPYDVRKKMLHEAARIVREEDPTRPSTLDKRLRGDLEVIALRALEKDRDRRYQTTLQLEQDITRYLAGETILAKRPSALDQLRRFAVRHKATAAAIVAVFVVMVIAFVVSTFFWISESQQREIAIKEGTRANDELKKWIVSQENLETMTATSIKRTGEAREAQQRAEKKEYEALASKKELERQASLNKAQKQRSLKQDYLYDITLSYIQFHKNADNNLLTKRLDEARETLRQLNQDSDKTDVVPFEWRYLNGQRSKSIATFRDHPDAILTVAVSPDGTRLASGGKDASISLWDLNTGEFIANLNEHVDEVNSVSFSPDGIHLASASDDGTVCIWESDRGKLITKIDISEDVEKKRKMRQRGGGTESTSNKSNQQVTSVAFSPDSTRVMTGWSDGSVWFCDVLTGKITGDEREHKTRVTAVAFGLDESCTVSASRDGIRVRSHGQDQPTVISYAGPTFAISPDGEFIATAQDGSVVLLRTSSGEVIKKMDLPNGFSIWPRPGEFAFSRDGALLAAANTDLYIWDVETGRQIDHITEHRETVSSLAFTPDGLLATGSWDTTVRFWWPGGNEFDKVGGMDGNGNKTVTFCFSPDSMSLASADSDGFIQIWNVDTNEPVISLTGAISTINSLAFNAAGTRLASSGKTGSGSMIQIWDTRTATLLKTMREPSEVTSIAFNPDGSQLAVASNSVFPSSIYKIYGGVHLRDVDTGTNIPLNPLLGKSMGYPSDVAKKLCYSSDGTRVACITETTIVLLDAETLKKVSDFDNPSPYDLNTIFDDFAFSPNDKELAAITSQGTIFIWDVVSTWPSRSRIDRREDTTQEHDRAINYNPEGTTLIVTSTDGGTEISDRNSGEKITTLEASPQESRRYGSAVSEFSPDGLRLAKADHEGNIRIWNTQSRAQLWKNRQLMSGLTSDFEPIVQEWVESSDENDVLLQTFKNEIKSLTPREATALKHALVRTLAAQRQDPLQDSQTSSLPSDSNADYSMTAMAPTATADLDFSIDHVLNAQEDNTFETVVGIEVNSDDFLELAIRANVNTEYSQPILLHTLAQAYASRNEITEALHYQEQAITLIKNTEDTFDFPDFMNAYFEKRLNEYRDLADSESDLMGADQMQGTPTGTDNP